jgi:DNA/RNA endonuclease YhcR with UshA esterase domain
MQIGDSVTYVDPTGVERDALVTAVHGPWCINLIYVSGDTARNDTYGRQIERESSVSIQSEYTAHGRFFRLKAA